MTITVFAYFSFITDVQGIFYILVSFLDAVRVPKVASRLTQWQSKNIGLDLGKILR